MSPALPYAGPYVGSVACRIYVSRMADKQGQWGHHANHRAYEEPTCQSVAYANEWLGSIFELFR